MSDPRYEGFSQAELGQAKKAWIDCSRASLLAKQGIAKVGSTTAGAENTRFGTFFGSSGPAYIAQMRQAIDQMHTALTTRPITIVYRPNIVVKHVPADRTQPMVPAMLGGGVAFTGGNVYGYVHRHLAGSGMRIIMGRWFIDDPDPIDGAAQTIYHEVSHKVLGTVDHIYGLQESKDLAAANPGKASTNADNFAWYAMSFIKPALA